MEHVMRRGRVNVMKASAIFFLVLVLIVAGVSGRPIVLNRSAVPISIERTTNNGLNDSMVVGGMSSMELPAAFTMSDITLRNQITGSSFGPFRLRHNAVMLVQSSGGLLSNIVTILIGTIIQGLVTALTTLVAAL